jgi:hypothetical protein
VRRDRREKERGGAGGGEQGGDATVLTVIGDGPGGATAPGRTA